MRPINTGYILQKKDGSLEMLSVRIASTTTTTMIVNLSDRKLLTITQTIAAFTSAWRYVVFTGQIISTGAYQINSFVNGVANTAVTNSDLDTYFFDSGKLFLGSDSSSLNGMRAFLWSFKVYTDHTSTTVGWTSTCDGSCVNCPPGGTCLSLCLIATFPTSYTSACTSCDSTFVCSIRGCRNTDTCRLCADKTCLTCISFSGPCTDCIPNASLGSVTCSCNSNAIYVKPTQSCDICDNLCAICSSTIYFHCSSCTLSNQLVSSVCLRQCPYGFTTSPCTPVSTALISINFNSDFSGVYGIMQTSSDPLSYHFFENPDVDDPIPAKNRGMYFDGSQYLVSTSNVYLSHSFSMGLWINAMNGNILEKEDTFILDCNGNMTITLENNLEEIDLVFTDGALFSDWVYVSLSISYLSATTTANLYINNVAKPATSYPNYLFRDKIDKKLFIGKSANSFYNGFIYNYKL